MAASSPPEAATALLRAVKATIHADSDPTRQALFADVLQQSVAARVARGLYARFGPGRASTVLVSLYGIKAWLAVNATATGRPTLLTVAQHRNARRHVDLVASWFAGEPIGTIHFGFGLASALAIPGHLGSLARGWRDITRWWRVLSLVDRRRDFLVSCRVACVLGSRGRADAVLRALAPGAVVVSSDTNPEELGFAAAARAVGLPTIFISHAHPPPYAPVLDFDLSILEGQAALDARRARGVPRGAVVFIGIGGVSRPMDPSRLTRPNPVIGIFAPKSVDLAMMAKLIHECRERLRPRAFLLRWHPSMLGSSRLDEFLPDRGDVTETPRDATLGEIVGQCDLVIADPGSNVHLEVLRSGVPSLAVSRLDSRLALREDQLRFVANRVVFPVAESLAQLPIDEIVAFYSADWSVRFSQYDAGYLRPDHELTDAARSAVRAALARHRGAANPA